MERQAELMPQTKITDTPSSGEILSSASAVSFRGPLLRFDKPSHGFCSDNSRIVLFVDRPFYNTVVLAGC